MCIFKDVSRKEHSDYMDSSGISARIGESDWEILTLISLSFVSPNINYLGGVIPSAAVRKPITYSDTGKCNAHL